MCREHDAPMPAGQVLIYPVIDPSFDTESYRRYATGYVNTVSAMQCYWRQYLDGDGLPSPAYLAAPLRAQSHDGSAAGGRRDRRVRRPATSEAVSYAQRLRAANVPVVHRDYPGLFHGFLTIMPFAAGAAARELLWADLRRLLAGRLGVAA